MAGLIYKKKEFKLPFGKDYIMNYARRSTFGSDEIFLTTNIGDKLDKKRWHRSNDVGHRWLTMFVRNHVI